MISLRQNIRFLRSSLERLSHLLGIARSFETGQTFHTSCQVRRPSIGRPAIKQDFCRLPDVIHVCAHTDFQPNANRRKPSSISHAAKRGSGEVVA